MQKIELMRVQDLMRAQQNKYSDKDRENMKDKLSSLENDRKKVVADFKKEISNLEKKNKEVQKNYEQSLKENQDMKKIMDEHKRLKQSL